MQVKYRGVFQPLLQAVILETDPIETTEAIVCSKPHEPGTILNAIVYIGTWEAVIGVVLLPGRVG
ncbi:MAG: hypothetical protein Kow0027_10440 [Saprospiraceae bacterium]